MNDLINLTYKQTKKLTREKFQETNNYYDEKMLNYCIETTGTSFEKEIEFDGLLNSVIDFDIQLQTTNGCNMKVYLNDVLLHNVTIDNNYFFSASYYIKDKNNLLLIFQSSVSCQLKINLLLKGNVKKNKNSLLKLENFNSNIYLVKDGLMSTSNNILSITNNINNINYYNTDNNMDVNCNYNNVDLSKNNIVRIYNISNNLYLEDMGNSKNLKLNKVTHNCCIVSSNNGKYNVIFVKDGAMFLNVYSEDMSSYTTKELSGLKHINAVKVKSISSDSCISCFWVQSKNDSWYLVDIDLNTGLIKSIRNYAKCDDVSSYYIGNKFYIFQAVKEGVKFECYDNLILTNRVKYMEFNNTTDAFYYNGSIYLLNGSVVQEVVE